MNAVVDNRRPPEVPARDRPPHVMHAVLRLDVGGLERIVLDLARVGRDRGGRVSVLCLETPGDLAAAAEAAGAEVYALGKPPGRTPGLPPQIARLVRDVAPDVIHTHQIGVLWYCGLAGCGVPIVHTEHGDHAAMARGPLAKLRIRWFCHAAARFTGAFCCVSESVAASVARFGTVPVAKVRVVINGIDTERYAGQAAGESPSADVPAARRLRESLGIPLGQAVVGTVGRLNEVKRHDLLLRGVAAMPSSPPRPHVLLVGDGPERAALESLAHELCLADRVHFAGYQSRPQDFLAAMDVFAMTSRMEGLPLGLLEAWATGLPVVSTNVGGIATVMRHEKTGLLVPSGDAAAVARAIGRLLADPALAVRLAEAGQAHVRQHFSLSRMADDYERLYREAIAAGAVYS